jgi:branched-chain amino acid transport system ATP-binding protein|tara:strand:- start:221308 stop:222018 length:711 start_codon:yes stop_codon:yes gene_type:complete
LNPLLEVKDIETSYGASQVLFGVSFNVAEGELVTLIGRNGMGKSTTVKTIMGVLSPKTGSIAFRGRFVHGAPSYVVGRSGVSVVPEGRQVFPNLSVRENLIATARKPSHAADPWTLDKVYAMFPRLRERERNLGSNLSGGEQQMLAIGRALLTNPELLILDEATEGLAPLARAEIWKALSQLKSAGLALVVIDKNIAPLLRLADRHYVMEKGRIVWQGSSDDLRAHPEVLQEYVGV